MAAACLLVLMVSAAQAWMPDPTARIQLKYEDEPAEQFLGNVSAPDHFRILDKDDSSIIVGGRNAVYNLSLYDLSENVDQRLDWPSTDAHRELCQLKGKSLDDCQNYPRVAVRASDGRTFVCATNAFKPQCRYYTRHASGVYTHDDDKDGGGRSPFDPEHNSTYVYTGGELFTATAADFAGADPLIYREPVRTEQYDQRMLNDPSFVGALATDTHAYFFYRETAVEYMNCGKAMYSRVARVCLNDKGGPYNFRDRFTSFMKARLNCSIPGDYPFYFDEIQASTELISGVYGAGHARSDIVYAVFTTSQNAIGGSAVCAFAMRDVLEAFEGPYKSQETMNSNWLPLDREKEPTTRPGSCEEDSRSLSSATTNFIKEHPLMDRAVPSFLERPLLVKVSLQYRFSALAVHAQVQAMSGKKYDVLYVGTDDGRVIKTVNVAVGEGDFKETDENESGGEEDFGDNKSKSPVRSVVISEAQVLKPGVAIKQLHVSLSNEKLIAVSGDIVKSVSLAHCNNVLSCRECASLQDPHCAWDSKQAQCVWVGNRKFPNPERFLQSIERGHHEVCNRLPPPPATHTNRSPGTRRPEQDEQRRASADERVPNEIIFEVVQTNLVETPADKRETDLLKVSKSETIYTAQALLTAVLLSCLVTLLVGFIIGYLFSRRFPHPFLSDTRPFNEQHNHLNSSRLSPLETPLNANPVAFPRSAKNVNMVANVGQLPLKQDNLHHDLGKEHIRNSTESLDKDYKCGTLQKVKKTYI